MEAKSNFCLSEFAATVEGALCLGLLVQAKRDYSIEMKGEIEAFFETTFFKDICFNLGLNPQVVMEAIRCGKSK